MFSFMALEILWYRLLLLQIARRLPDHSFRQTKKTDNSVELSALVEDSIKLSNDFIEDFNRIINFIKN